MTDERFSFLWLRVPKVANSRRRSIRIGGLLQKQCLIVLVVNVIQGPGALSRVACVEHSTLSSRAQEHPLAAIQPRLLF